MTGVLVYLVLVACDPTLTLCRDLPSVRFEDMGACRAAVLTNVGFWQRRIGDSHRVMGRCRYVLADRKLST